MHSMRVARRGRAALLSAALAATLAVACGSQAPPAQQPTGATPKYPDARFPSYLRPPNSIDEVMPQIRPLVRNKTGFQGAGFGAAQPGETIAIVATIDAEDLIVEAVKRGLEERGVTVQILHDYDLVQVGRDDALAYRRARQGHTAEAGYLEVTNWIESTFPDVPAVRKWLQERRPDLHDALFPKGRDLSPHLREVQQKLSGDSVGAAIRTYLETRPGVRGVYWGKGGGTTLRRWMHPLESRFLGLFTADNRWDVMSAIGNYPGDVWQLAEEQMMEPLIHVDRIEASDPEGTNVVSTINEAQAQSWARGVYQRGHLYMFPNQATGRFGYSVIDYPSFQNEWLPREPLATIDGVIAGTVNHSGFYPRWEVTLKGGYVAGVKGGGVFGDALRTFLQFPNINDKVYPFHAPEHPGYFWLYEVAFGTHPKGFRNPLGLDNGTAIPERLRSGVIHWGLGVTLHHDPNERTRSQKLIDFTAHYNLPRDHGWHTHTYFTTYRVHLRNANKWVTMLDRGRLASLDNAEVRALASRYGNPDDLLTEDWRPEIPGINAAGQYADYANNPWPTVKSVIDQVKAGTYGHFFPPRRPPAVATKAGFE